MSFIYKITNIINGKLYIGQTVNPIEKRLLKHIGQVNCKNKCSALYAAFTKYGKENFKITEVISGDFSKEELNTLEIFYIIQFNSLSPNGYNLQTGGGSFRVCESVKKQMSELMTGREISWSDKISETMKEKWKNKDYREAMSKAHSKPYGKYKKHSKPLRIEMDAEYINTEYKKGRSIFSLSKELNVSFYTIKKRIDYGN